MIAGALFVSANRCLRPADARRFCLAKPQQRVSIQR
jgi:hypothetical protein